MRSTAAPEAWHRAGPIAIWDSPVAHTEEKRPHRLAMPRAALPARLSYFRLLAMVSPTLDAR